MTDRNAYEPPADSYGPAPTLRAAPRGFRKSETLVLVLTILLGLGLVLDLIGIASDFFQLELLERMSGNQFTQAEADATDSRQALIGLLQVAVYVTTVVVFGIFLHRASSNARALGGTYMRFSPGWAVGWFFVPIANLFKPYQAVREIWEVSTPGGGLPMASALLPLWWAAWLASNFMGNISFRLSLNAYDVDSLKTSSQVDIATAIVSVICAAFALVLVRRLHAMQLEKSGELGLAAA